jgi:hypothetical protein
MITAPNESSEEDLMRQLSAVLDEPMTIENMGAMAKDMTGYLVGRMMPIIQSRDTAIRIDELKHAKMQGYIPQTHMHKVDRRIASLTKQQEDKLSE